MSGIHFTDLALHSSCACILRHIVCIRWNLSCNISGFEVRFPKGTLCTHPCKSQSLSVRKFLLIEYSNSKVVCAENCTAGPDRDVRVLLDVYALCGSPSAREGECAKTRDLALTEEEERAILTSDICVEVASACKPDGEVCGFVRGVCV